MQLQKAPVLVGSSPPDSAESVCRDTELRVQLRDLPLQPDLRVAERPATSSSS